MNQRLSSILAFSGTVMAAMLGAAILTGEARAEGPIGEATPFTSSRTRAEVRAELMRDRDLASSYAQEWIAHASQPVQQASGHTRAQARAEYIAARDEVRAMNSEDGGASYLARSSVRTPGTLFARRLAE